MASHLLGGDEATDVRHVAHEQGAVGVGDGTETGVVPAHSIKQSRESELLCVECGCVRMAVSGSVMGCVLFAA